MGHQTNCCSANSYASSLSNQPEQPTSKNTCGPVLCRLDSATHDAMHRPLPSLCRTELGDCGHTLQHTSYVQTNGRGTANIACGTSAGVSHWMEGSLSHPSERPTACSTPSVLDVGSGQSRSNVNGLILLLMAAAEIEALQERQQQQVHRPAPPRPAGACHSPSLKITSQQSPHAHGVEEPSAVRHDLPLSQAHQAQRSSSSQGQALAPSGACPAFQPSMAHAQQASRTAARKVHLVDLQPRKFASLKGITAGLEALQKQGGWTVQPSQRQPPATAATQTFVEVSSPHAATVAVALQGTVADNRPAAAPPRHQVAVPARQQASAPSMQQAAVDPRQQAAVPTRQQGSAAPKRKASDLAGTGMHQVVGPVHPQTCIQQAFARPQAAVPQLRANGPLPTVVAEEDRRHLHVLTNNQASLPGRHALSHAAGPALHLRTSVHHHTYVDTQKRAKPDSQPVLPPCQPHASNGQFTGQPWTSLKLRPIHPQSTHAPPSPDVPHHKRPRTSAPVLQLSEGQGATPPVSPPLSASAADSCRRTRPEQRADRPPSKADFWPSAVGAGGHSNLGSIRQGAGNAMDAAAQEASKAPHPIAILRPVRMAPPAAPSCVLVPSAHSWGVLADSAQQRPCILANREPAPSQHVYYMVA